jgi:gamma-glutamyltranspeptidase/glutathione hydrolase
VNKRLATAIKSSSKRLAPDPGSAKLLFAKGEPLSEGSRFRNSDLADLLEKLAEDARVDDFYRGKIAEKLAAEFRRHGGLVTIDDLAEYKPLLVEPLRLPWQGHVIHTAPLTAGGITVLQAITSLDALGWPDRDRSDLAAVHARVEALRIAWADRLQYLGDPQHGDVPTARLLSKEHAKRSAAAIRAAVTEKKPVPIRFEGPPADGTIHLSAADKSGMMAALTFTHGNAFGAQVTVDGLGLTLGHGMSRFDPQPGRPNSPGPRKRPLNNMCPTIVTKEGKPVLALGAVGGRRIVNTVFDVLAYYLGNRRSLIESVKSPRVHVEESTTLTLEAAWPADVKELFTKLGYAVKTGPAAFLNAVERNPDNLRTQLAAR